MLVHQAPAHIFCHVSTHPLTMVAIAWTMMAVGVVCVRRRAATGDGAEVGVVMLAAHRAWKGPSAHARSGNLLELAVVSHTGGVSKHLKA